MVPSLVTLTRRAGLSSLAELLVDFTLILYSPLRSRIASMFIWLKYVTSPTPDSSMRSYEGRSFQADHELIYANDVV